MQWCAVGELPAPLSGDPTLMAGQTKIMTSTVPTDLIEAALAEDWARAKPVWNPNGGRTLKAS
jgi:hypothetical protein